MKHTDLVTVERTANNLHVHDLQSGFSYKRTCSDNSWEGVQRLLAGFDNGDVTAIQMLIGVYGVKPVGFAPMNRLEAPYV
jgi:hypothetical protein